MINGFWMRPNPPHPTFRLRNALQHFYATLHHTIEGVHTKYQAKVPRIVHLTENLGLVSGTCDSVPQPFPGVAEANEFQITPRTMWRVAEVDIPIDDNDIEGCRRCDGGEYNFEEIRCGVVGGVNRFCCGLECSKRLVE